MARARKGAERGAAAGRPSGRAAGKPSAKKAAAKEPSAKESGGGGARSGAGPGPKPESKNPKPTFESVWAMLGEVAKAQRRTEEARLEGERALKESQLKTEKALRRLEKSLDKAAGDFRRKWGEFMENLVGGDLEGLLRARGIPVADVATRVTWTGDDGIKKAEYDLVARDGDVVVVVEVKTTLTKDDVKAFLAKLALFKGRFPAYRGRRILGGVAFLGTGGGEGVAEFAEESGLFAIRSPGGGPGLAVVENGPGFAPREF